MFEHVLQVESHGPQVPFCGTSGEGHDVLHWFKYNNKLWLHDVHVLIVVVHVKQFVSQKSQLFVIGLAIVVPLMQLDKHWF